MIAVCAVCSRARVPAVQRLVCRTVVTTVQYAAAVVPHLFVLVVYSRSDCIVLLLPRTMWVAAGYSIGGVLNEPRSGRTSMSPAESAAIDGVGGASREKHPDLYPRKGLTINYLTMNPLEIH